ncbi:MAG: hypothetical protein PVF49_05340 [Anaerolineales bacterium]|jgi:hypothetical protein
MSKRKDSRQRRTGYCLSTPWASQSNSPVNRESSAENVRQQLIKAYLRRPVLDGSEAGDIHPVSLAEAIEQVECMLDSCQTAAA